MKIKINRKSIVYILCPPKYATGGTELLHQLCDALIKKDVNAQIFYWPQVKNPTNKQFEKYKIEVATSIKDCLENIFIAPEIDNYKIFEFSKIQKVIWWLSIDNHFKNIEIRNSNLKIKLLDFIFRRTYFNLNKNKHDVVHFAQSIYAKDFLKNKGINDVELLSDYINDSFLNGSFDKNEKKDIVLYNPKKGIEFTQKIIESYKGKTNIEWIPIQNLTRDGVFALLKKAKVYIDFGNHPGKDRFPREAAVLGCCIITNKSGSAKNNIDVNIPEEYKFEGKGQDLSKVLNTIENCITDYSNSIDQFQVYRDAIHQEKKIFFEEVEKIFKN